MYVRTVGEKELNFQVSGMLWQRSLVMRDPETETLWSHILGRGMKGELEGAELERIPSTITTWSEWKERHPESSVLAMTRTVGRYDAAQWEKSRKFVFGISGDKEGPSPAVSLEVMQKKGVVMIDTEGKSFVMTHEEAGGSVQAFVPVLGKESLQFEANDEGTMKDLQTGSTWSRSTGEALSGPHLGKRLQPVAGTLSFVQAWEAFYPEDTILK